MKQKVTSLTEDLQKVGIPEQWVTAKLGEAVEIQEMSAPHSFLKRVEFPRFQEIFRKAVYRDDGDHSLEIPFDHSLQLTKEDLRHLVSRGLTNIIQGPHKGILFQWEKDRTQEGVDPLPENEDEINSYNVAEVLLANAVFDQLEQMNKAPKQVEIVSWMKDNVHNWPRHVSMFVDKNAQELQKAAQYLKDKDYEVADAVNVFDSATRLGVAAFNTAMDIADEDMMEAEEKKNERPVIVSIAFAKPGVSQETSSVIPRGFPLRQKKIGSYSIPMEMSGRKSLEVAEAFIKQRYPKLKVRGWDTGDADGSDDAGFAFVEGEPENIIGFNFEYPEGAPEEP